MLIHHEYNIQCSQVANEWYEQERDVALGWGHQRSHHGQGGSELGLADKCPAAKSPAVLSLACKAPGLPFPGESHIFLFLSRSIIRVAGSHLGNQV